jgi:hypothetical protein
MPGGVRWNWGDEPFSYQKLCYIIPMIVFLVAVAIPLSGNQWLPESSFLNVMLVGAVGVVGYLFFLKVVWWLLPARIRARIPYNRQEAESLKGDVRSFRDFCRVVFRKSDVQTNPK